MAKPIRFVVYGNDEPLLSLYVGKDEVRVSHQMWFVARGQRSLVGIHRLLIAWRDWWNEKGNHQPVHIGFLLDSRYLQVVDKVNGYIISAYVTPGNIHFILSCERLTCTYVFHSSTQVGERREDQTLLHGDSAVIYQSEREMDLSCIVDSEPVFLLLVTNS